MRTKSSKRFPGFNTRRKSAHFRAGDYPVYASLQDSLCFFRHPLPTHLSARLAVRFPYLNGDNWAYPVPLILHNGLAFVYPPGESWITWDETRASQPYPSPFWLRPDSIFGLSSLTAFINDSHVLRIPSFLAPIQLDAARVEVASRFPLQTFRSRASLSLGLHTKPLPGMHAGVRNCQ